MVNSRVKGAAGEREWAGFLRGHGFTARRGRQFSGVEGRDVVCDDLDGMIHFEVKRVEAFRLYPAIAQAKEDCPEGKWRVVAHRRNNEDWVCVMPAEDWIDLVKENLELKGMPR